ncbi:MAG: InlB B-repeat-containing protein [Holophagaceae bacterium]|nr:InlB B-repeat-containing protein [Holophagaceae bacterium]
MNKYLNWLGVAVIALATLIGCSSSSDEKDKPPQNYTVVFNTNGGSLVNDHTVLQGNSIASSPTTVWDGYVFEGWYFDNNTFNNKVAFPYTPTASITLHANWTIIPPVDPDTPDFSIVKFEAVPYDPDFDGDQIKYSFTYGDYSYYYIYLGTLRNIPISPWNHYLHTPELPLQRTWSRETITKESLSRSVTEAVGAAKNIIDNFSLSAGTGSKLSVEIGAKVTPIPGFTVQEKIGGELTFETHISKSATTGFQETTSLTVTETYSTETIYAELDSFTYAFTRDDPGGYYRMSYFAISDVYLYVIKETNTKDKLVYFEFKEHVRPGEIYPGRDYSATGNFGKQDASGFELDMALLENLPPAGMATVKFDKNNSDSGSTEADPQAIMVNVGGRPGNQMSTQSAQPMRPDHLFNGWNTNANGTGEPFLFNSLVTENITVYAQWEPAPDLFRTLTARVASAGGGRVVFPYDGFQKEIFHGTSVNIEAEPASHYTFDKWTVESGDAVITSPTSQKTTVTVNANTTIIAHFKPNYYTLTLRSNNDTWGYVSPTNMPNIIGGVPVTIRATPLNSSYYRFNSWTPDDPNMVEFATQSASTTVTLKGDATITANFGPITQYTLMTEPYPKNWGTASGRADGTDHDPITPISISANPYGGYRFVNWTVLGGGKANAEFENAKPDSDGRVSDSASTKVALRTDATIRANFLPASATYGGEVGRLELKSTGTYILRLRVQYWDENGNMKTHEFGNTPGGQTRNIDPGNEANIPDGSWVRVYAWVNSGADRQGAEYFIYRKGSPKTACYRIPTVWPASTTLYFDGVK